MIHYVFTVRDSAANLYNPPFYARTAGQAQRDFDHMIQNGEGAAQAHPGDFELYMLGTYNDETGEFNIMAHAELIRRGKDAAIKPE